VFPSAGHLASWAGLAQGSNESAGRVKSSKTRPGNRYLKGALGIAALSTARSKNTYFSAKYKRVEEHLLLGQVQTHRRTARTHACHRRRGTRHGPPPGTLLTNGDFYRDPGADYYNAYRPDAAKARALNQLQALGYRVTLEPLAGTA